MVERQARAKETRQRILDAARVAFATKGFDGVNLRSDILGPAGVSVGSFYHQFEDKTDLLVTVLNDAVEARRRQVLDQIDAANDLVPLEAARAGLERFVLGLERTSEFWQIQIHERSSADPRIRGVVEDSMAMFQGMMSERFQARFGVSRARADRASEFVFAFTSGYAIGYYAKAPSERPELRGELLDDIVGFLLAGARATFANRDQRSSP